VDGLNERWNPVNLLKNIGEKTMTLKPMMFINHGKNSLKNDARTAQ
jgi:hypothetical protein